MGTTELIDLDPLLEKIEDGAGYWRNFQKKYRICSRDIVIVMSSDRQEFHSLILQFLHALKVEKKVDAIYIVHKNNLSTKYIKKTATAFVNIVDCTDLEMENLCLLAHLYKFSEQVIFDDYTNICDCDGKFLIDGISYTEADIVAISFLGLNSIPKNIGNCRELGKKWEEIDKQETGIEFRRMNWEKAEQKIKTGKNYEATNAGMEQMIIEKTRFLIDEEKINSADEIVLFGMNKSSALIQSVLADYQIVAVIDNDKRKAGRKMNGIPVYEPSEYLKEYDTRKKIIIASKYYHSMCEQLYQFGYEVGREVFVVYYREHFYDALPKTIAYYEQQAKLGREIYIQLRENGAQGTIFLCPYPGTGDIYLIGLYLNQYMKENRIDRYALVVCSNACKKVAELFGIHTILIAETEVHAVISYARVIGMQKLSVQVLNDSFGEQNAIAKLRGYKNINFKTMYTDCIMHLKDKTVHPPCVKEDAEIFFEQYHFQKGKTVLLSPYANTVNGLPDTFWEMIVNILQADGYDVCTNIASDDEMPVKGTEGIFIPYQMIIDFLNKAGYFIGIRSGLCDIISTTVAQIFVLYPKKMPFGSGTLYDYFSLKKMNLREKRLIELEYELGKEEEILDDITGEIINGAS